MARAISRDSFNELKNYLGVYLQQGRVILDADWNENQDIAVSFLRRLTREAVGQGSPNQGFGLAPVFPPPIDLAPLMAGDDDDSERALQRFLETCMVSLMLPIMEAMFGSVPFFLAHPGVPLDRFESAAGLALSSPQGLLRIGTERPYEGKGFARLSGHAGPVTITRTLDAPVDISQHDLATFRFRLNEEVAGEFTFFVEDADGHRNEWLISNPAFGKSFWFSGFASPLNLRFHITSTMVMPGQAGREYSTPIGTFGARAPVTWSVRYASNNQPVEWLTLDIDNEANAVVLEGTAPATVGDVPIIVTATDASGAVSERRYTIRIGDPLPPDQPPTIPINVFTDPLMGMLFSRRTRTPTGQPADLTRIKRYGFAGLYQDTAHPLVWDLDNLQLGSAALREARGSNNFVIRGSEFSQFLDQLTLLATLMGLEVDDGPPPEDIDEILRNLLELANTQFNLLDPSLDTAGKMYVDGYPCVQIKDVLYSDQADPNDPPLLPPPVGTIRKDAVYLDVWKEPVTYIDDPDIREVALGGPDSATRLRVRYRVRVNQGGSMPTGDGRGHGTLATAGVYRGTANRLYLVEIDHPGDFGTATFRWSEDNASTIQRLIETIPPGTTRIKVEDAAGFHAGDLLLIRTEFGEERHVVASVFGNVIVLQQPTAATFRLEDRPKVQRWNGFGVSIVADPADPTVSTLVSLSDGVQVRFGGRGMLRGDCWNFKTRFLAGDEASAIDPDARIETIAYDRPHGVQHHYAPIGIITRNGSDLEPHKIQVMTDRRPRIGNASATAVRIEDLEGLTGTDAVPVGGATLAPTGLDSKILVTWSGDLFLPDNVPDDAQLTVQVGFYSDQRTDPATEPDTGKIQDRGATIPLARKPRGVEVPLTLSLTNSSLGKLLFLPMPAFATTALHVFVQLSKPDFSIQLTNMQLSVIELKKSF